MKGRTRYAKSAGVNIAYQVVGEGPVDVLVAPGWVSHVEEAWEEQSYSRFLTKLVGFARLIIFDRRGTGLSDPVAHLPTLEERMDDVRAVMDAAGSERAFLVGISEGGPMCTLFAASHPERTAGLILCNTFACNIRSDDYPIGAARDEFRSLMDVVESRWGEGLTAEVFAPSRTGDADFKAGWGRFERLSVSPGGARKLIGMIEDIDVRDVLSTVNVPTLVIHRRGDQVISVSAGRYMAEHIAGARFVELEGKDHFIWTEGSDAYLDEIEHFVTGARSVATADRVLATVLFVDIVDSTRMLAELGDKRWGEVLDRFYTTLRRELDRFRGREIDSAGDGVFATFDGPARAIECACAVRDGVGPLGLAVRCGLHTGECEVIGDKVGGIAVHLGARVAATAEAGEVLVSSTVKDLVAGSELRFAERGTHELKGIPGAWNLFAVCR